MSSEKPIQDTYIKALEAKGIEYIHIPSRAFSSRYRTPKQLKYLPDLIFLYDGTLFMRELGLPGAHLDRKALQMEKMRKWKEHGADIAVILSEDAALDDLRLILG